MNQKRSKGFSLLEVLLSLIVVTVAGLGVYSLFDSGVKSTNVNDAENQAVQIANVYTDLASSDLTNNVDSEGIVTLLKNSGRLSSKYFSSEQMHNAFGVLDFSVVTPTAYSFAVKIPLGCLSQDSSVPEQFFNKVKDLYSCNASGSKDYANCVKVACEPGGARSSLTLYFDMNY